MIDSILAVIVLIIAGWAIAKNYDAKVVLFIAALVLLYSGLLLGHNVLGAKATTGLWILLKSSKINLFVSTAMQV